MTYFNMESLDTIVIPDQVKNADSMVQRDWIHTKSLEMVDQFVMSDMLKGKHTVNDYSERGAASLEIGNLNI